MDEKDSVKSAFHTYERLFCYTKMPFGRKNDAATFQREADGFLTTLKFQPGAACIDDIIIFPKSAQQHIAPTKEYVRPLGFW